MAVSALFVVYSCNKEQDADTKATGIKLQSEAVAKFIPNSTKEVSVETGGSFVVSFAVGHEASFCGNACLGITGNKYHAECQGYGIKCAKNASTSFTLLPELNKTTGLYNLANMNSFSVYLTGQYDLTDEDSFYFPNRSLLVDINNGAQQQLWMNIPEQLLERDIEGYFTLYEVYYTTSPVYQNN